MSELWWEVLGAVLLLPACYIWNLWAVMLLYVLLFALAMDLANILVTGLSKKTRPRWAAVWRSGLVPLLCTALLLSWGCWNMRQVRETDYTVYTQKDIRPAGWRIALLSDLHFGTTMDAAKLRTICARVSETKPDFVVLAGDIVDEHTSKDEMRAAAQALGGIRSRYGTYYIFGNHDKNALISEAIKMVDDMYDAGNGYEVVPAAQIIRLFWESSRDQENAGRNFKFSLDEAAQDYNAYFRSGGK